MSKVYIEIDATPWMEADGISTSVFIGDGCEAAYESKHTYEELINQELEAHTVFGKLTDYADDAERFVIALEEAAKHARTRFEELCK